MVDGIVVDRIVSVTQVGFSCLCVTWVGEEGGRVQVREGTHSRGQIEQRHVVYLLPLCLSSHLI